MKEKEEEQPLEQTPPNVPAGDNRLEAVRELLFGQNVEEYRGDIKEIRDLIRDQRQEIDAQSADLESRLVKKLDESEKRVTELINSSVDQINQQLDQLTQDKVHRKELADQLIAMAKKLNP